MPTRNHLLAALPTPAFDALSVDLTPRSLDPGHVLLSTDERSGTIWFPLSGAVSLTPETREGEVAQAAVVGREGLVELSTAFGEATAAPWRAFVVLPGAALTIDAERFRGHLLGQRSLLAATHAYAARVIAVLAQGAVCSRFHSVRERAARWLLVLHDRADADAFPITQQMLADMIGAHRPTLSLVIQAFAAEALIRHARGTVAVANRSGLEAAACECYARVDAAPGRRSGGAAPPGTFDASFRRPETPRAEREAPMPNLQGRIAFVTGGARGIGRGICLKLAESGADVVVNYHANQAAADETVAAVQALGRRALAVQGDVADRAACEAMTKRALDEFGFVDILVNNAGVGATAIGRPIVTDTKPEDFRWLMETHAIGSFHMCQLLVPQMRERPRGDVIMISSVGAQSFGATGGTYSAAKAAMEALAYTLAKEERRNGIHVNVVAPGLVETDMGEALVKFTRGVQSIHDLEANQPFGFLCQPADIANAVAFLASDEARYVTNQRITVSGGGF